MQVREVDLILRCVRDFEGLDGGEERVWGRGGWKEGGWFDVGAVWID